MDGFTIGLILRQLLSSGLGWKPIVLILLVGGMGWTTYKAVLFIVGILQSLVASRDALLATLARDLKASDERRAAYDRDTASILATINTKLDTEINQADKVRQDIGSIKDSINVLKGAVS
jgi:hypothetical protein